MENLNVIIHSPPKQAKKILVEMDAEKFERLAANLGLFSPEFINSLAQAERDYKKGRIKMIKSLRALKS